MLSSTSPVWTAHDWIAPDNLLSLVRNTAPFLFTGSVRASPGRLIDTAGAPDGFLRVLASADLLERLEPSEQMEDYFALCLACHHATVATFVPTDVDTKIRGLIWRRVRSPESLRRMFEFALDAHRWSIAGVSKRATELAGVGPVSGHDGEMLSVLAGALGAFIDVGDSEWSERAAHAIDAELHREALEFEWARSHNGFEIGLLKLTATLTHNAGDLDQGISFWRKSPEHRAFAARFGRLAHENTTPYGGGFAVAARLYKALMASEGHRHYPLRAVRALRQSADLLLPLSPFLDDWGANIATHAALSVDDRAEVLAALLAGCRKIPNQKGYYRAIRGMADALGGGVLDDIARRMSSAARTAWKDAGVRKEIAVSRTSFESALKKAASRLL